MICAGCTNGGGAGAGSGESLEVAFSSDPSNPLFAVAQSDDGTEFAFYADVDATGGEQQTSSVNTRLSGGSVVKTSLDDDGRPEKIVTSDASATIEYESGSAKVVVVSQEGVTETDVAIEEPTARARSGGSHPTALQTGPRNLCDRVRRYVDLMRMLFDCQPDETSGRCAPALVELARATRRICDLPPRLRPALLTTIQMEPTLIPLRAVASFASQPDADGLLVELTGSAMGGRGDYAFEWFVGMGPTRPDIADAASASVRLTCPGPYLIRLVVRDGEGQRAPAAVNIDVPPPPGLFGLGPHPRFIQPDQDLNNPGIVTIVAEVRDCNDDAQWRLFAIFRPAGPTSAPQEIDLATGAGNAVAASFDSAGRAAGEYRLALSATDSGRSVADTTASGDLNRIVTNVGPRVLIGPAP